MSTVLAMRFNEDQGILIADEATWHLGHVYGYRRTNYGDALAVLLDPEAAGRLGLQAVYAGVGFPSLHHEVAGRARRELARHDASSRRDARWVGRVVHEAFVETHRRMVEDKVRFSYGVGIDELNTRTFTRDGEKRTLGQELVVEGARQMVAGKVGGNAFKRIFDNSGLAVVHDRNRGLQCWYVDHQACSLGFATPIAVLGEGNDVTNHLVSRFVQRRDLGTRRKGFSLEEGLYIAMSIAAEIRTSVGKMGGYFQIAFIDGERGIREIVDDKAHLATEVMWAHLWGFIDRNDASEMVQALVLDEADDLEVERKLFETATDPDRLRRYLLGFKPVEAPIAVAIGEATLPDSDRSAPGGPRRKERASAILEAVETVRQAPAATKKPRPTASRRDGARRNGGNIR